MKEKVYVISNFQKHFSKYRDQPVAIYGLGKHTEEVLNAFPDYRIVGLMDEVRTGETVYGKEVISCEEALERGVRTIVIIARAANVRIIYYRIAEFCEKSGISVFDINGEKQSLQENDQTARQEIKFGKRAELYEKMAGCQIISFDIFDTLIMRNVLVPTDVFTLVEEKIGRREGYFPFAKERRKAEWELLREGRQPEFDEIYGRLACHSAFARNHAGEWGQLELEEEKKAIIAREGMKEILCDARKSGKQVFFTSDMYLTSDRLAELLNGLGIEAVRDEFIISCEYGMSKRNGLHTVLRNRFPGQRILHVGDNAEADGRCAIHAGIDEVFLLGSAYEQLDKSSAGELLKCSAAWANRRILGEFAAKQFQDPFQFERNKGRVRIDTEYELGCYFLAPMLSAFLQWMLRKAKEYSLTRLLLTSRDGYIVKEALDRMKTCKPEMELPEYTYFYTSRAVCVLAAIQKEEDILEAAEGSPFSGSAEELLQRRFRIRRTDILEKEAGERDRDYILRHKEKILEQADIARRCYRVYLSKLGIRDDDRCGFVDFVSGGTCQYGLHKFWDKPLVGLYFLKLPAPEKEKLTIDALYQKTNLYAKSTALEEKYFFMERIMTSLEPTVRGFSEDGIPIFEQEKRPSSELESLRKVHQGLVDGALRYRIEDEKLADAFVNLLDRNRAVCHLSFAGTASMTDEFCNRTFDVPVF